MPEWTVQALVIVAQALEIVGAGALVLGFLIASAGTARQTFRLGAAHAFASYRRALARVVQIGLEILVAATIIKTVTVDPSLEGLGLLAGMVAIRTILGWTLVLEVTGRWPWQPAAGSERTS